MSNRTQHRQSIANAPLTGNDPHVLPVIAASRENAFHGTRGVDDQIFSHYPNDWYSIARQAWKYYRHEPLVKNCINTWRDFAVGQEIEITLSDRALQDRVMPQHDSMLVSDSLARRLKLTKFVRDMVQQLLVKGMAVGYKRLTEDENDIFDLTCMNPVSVYCSFDSDHNITRLEQRPYNEDNDTPTNTGTNIVFENPDPRKFLVLRWDAPDYSNFGNTMIEAAFHDVELHRKYRRAEAAIADRWAEPLQLFKIGTNFGNTSIMPTEAIMQSYAHMMNNLPRGHVPIVPYYFSYEIHTVGAEVLAIEKKILSCEQAIMVALGVPQALVTGSGPNFATAKVGMKKLLIMISVIQQFAKEILDWVLLDWLEMQEETAAVQVEYPGLNLSPDDDVEQQRLLEELYDRRVISRETLQRRCNLDPDIETDNMREEGFAPVLERFMTPLNQAVETGWISPNEAREIVGLPPMKAAPPEPPTEPSATPDPAPTEEPVSE